MLVEVGLNVVVVQIAYFCQTPVLGLGLGVGFSFPNNNKNKNKNNMNKNPHIIFHRREGTRGMKFDTQIKLSTISSG